MFEGQSPPQELKVCPRSGPYLLVCLKLISLCSIAKYVKTLNCTLGFRNKAHFYLLLENKGGNLKKQSFYVLKSINGHLTKKVLVNKEKEDKTTEETNKIISKKEETSGEIP